MKFRRLRLAGFKSFVDPVDLKIEDGLTGVVGPNGCGKSNLLEAMRWVMGESSPKSMRGGGMEDVIFAGTDRRPSRDAANVTLHLDNADRRAPAQFNELEDIEVSRHIERGLGSAYRVNGRDVRQKDVQLLFADAATGAHSPALVSQGKIGSIINAKPQERRKLLEEAAGIAGLHVRRKDAEQRLRAAESNLSRLEDVLGGLTSQAASLKRQARQAERYKKLSDQIRATESMLLYAKWREAAADVEGAKSELEALKAKIDEATRLAASISAKQAEAASGLPPLREAEAAAAAILQRLTIQRENLENERQALEQRQAAAEVRRETALRDIEREDSLVGDAEAALTRLATEEKTLADRLAAAEQKLAPSAARIAELETEVESEQTRLSDALTRQADVQGRRRMLEAELGAAHTAKSRAEAERAKAEEQISAARANDDVLKAVDVAKTKSAAAAETVKRSGEELTVAESAREAAEAAREQHQAARHEARAALTALESELASLRRMLGAREGTQARDPLIDKVTVAPGYETAFAAALGEECGAEVGGDEDARGRRFRGADSDGDPSLPGGTPLSEFVKAPVELERRLAQIGVVEDTELVNLMTKLRPGQRLVSKSGRLVRWDGFVADGEAADESAEVLRQRNRLGEIEAALPAAEKALEAAEAEVNAAEAARAAASATIEEVRGARRKAEADEAAAKLKLSELAGEIERRAAQMDAFEALTGRLKLQMEEAEERVSAADAELVELPAPEVLAAAVTEARNVADAGRSTLANARAEHMGLERALEADSGRRNAIASERDGWSRRLSESGDQRQALVKRASEAASEIETLAAAPQELDAKQQKLVGELADAETARSAAADRLAEAETEERKLDRDAREAGEILASFREERGRLEARAENYELRRAELNRIASERFQCSPQMLPAKMEFHEDAVTDAATLSAAFEKLTGERERMGPVNLRADVELEEIESTLESSGAEREELETAIARLRGSIGALNREGRARLLTAFEEVNRHFGELFTSLFGGGEAHLHLVESDDPLEAGLEIMAQPPGKKLQSMTLLSGGEQALTACALIFGLFLTNPAPICVLDEVDAPLDDANIERFCDLLDRMTALTDTRFLIVTHNAVTMSRMHRLYGVTMGEKGVSQLVSVDLGGAETLLAAE